MASYEDRMKDYIQVNERILLFHAKYPNGALQSEVVSLSETRVTMKGIAYRYPGDPLPGIGHSSMAIPGKTPYTRDSELENAETSAWGRALASLGFEIKRSIASAEEVEAKQEDGDSRAAGESAPPERKKRAPKEPSPNATTPEEQAALWRRGVEVLGQDAKDWFKARFAEADPPVKDWPQVMHWQAVNWRKMLDEFQGEHVTPEGAQTPADGKDDFLG